MRVEHLADGVTLYNADCRDVLPTLTPVDACVTDPPYGLSFMGKSWDYDVPSAGLWAEVLQSLKPGGHLLAFAGTRTQHRMACAIEDAGFELRDMIAWVYGSGFPKSRNLDGEWQGWGTALKPALEPITVARKPLEGRTVAENVLAHGTGALNIDGCRVEGGGAKLAHGSSGAGNLRSFGGLAREYQPGTGRSYSNEGRWPANLIHDGSEEVVAGFPQGGASGAVKRQAPSVSNSRGEFAGIERDFPFYADTGSAARFFYCAKASKADRGDNSHPTVKPTDLMAYLCRLVTPPGGFVLDPFMGSGSTGKAAIREGFRFIGIERDPVYFDIACRRLSELLRHPKQEALAL